MSKIFVDWLSFTLPFELMDVERGFMALTSDARRVAWDLFNLHVDKQETPHYGYIQAWSLGLGGVIQYNPYREDMGISVVLPGQLLKELGWRQFLNIALEKGHVSRIDVTCDVMDDQFDCEGLYKLVDQGLAVTKARGVSFITSKTGQTLYVGKRTSDRMLRLYDKGGESGGQRGIHWRIEAEIKGKASMSVARRMLADTSSAYELFKSILECPGHRGYTEAIGSDFTEQGFETEKRRKDTMAWLCGLVAKTLADQERLNQGSLQQFLQSVNRYLDNP